MKGQKLIIFDFDGVILDSWEHSYKLNVRDWPELQPHEHKSFFNGNIFDAIAKMPPSAISQEDKDKYFKTEYYPSKHKLPMFAGIPEVVKTLADKYTLVINTSALATYTEDYLTKAGLRPCFDKVYGSEISKDKITKFKKILEDYKVPPDKCVLITDTVGDVLEAEHCSIPSIAVTYGYQDRSYFESIKDEILGFADKPADILGLL